MIQKKRNIQGICLKLTAAGLALLLFSGCAVSDLPEGSTQTDVPTTEAPAPPPTEAPGTLPPEVTDPTAEPPRIPETSPPDLTDSFTDTGDSALNEQCDEVLLAILDLDMTQREKAYAIYQWVASNIRYMGTSDTSDWIEGAKYALEYKRGNCYAFYTAARALLSRAGFETMEASSYGNKHYWVLVQVDGQWRHLDVTPGWGAERFLWTGTQIKEYKYYSEKYEYYIYYVWDPQGYPDTD